MVSLQILLEFNHYDIEFEPALKMVSLNIGTV